MTAVQPAEILLADLARCGIELKADGDSLRYRPRSAVTPEMAERLRDCKVELLVMITARDTPATVQTEVEPAPADPQAAADLSQIDWDALFPLPTGLQHKRPRCLSVRWWRHVFGGTYCLDCWPPTDPAAIAKIV